jgi:hypothetical protein
MTSSHGNVIQSLLHLTIGEDASPSLRPDRKTGFSSLSDTERPGIKGEVAIAEDPESGLQMSVEAPQNAESGLPQRRRWVRKLDGEQQRRNENVSIGMDEPVMHRWNQAHFVPMLRNQEEEQAESRLHNEPR